ncbi:hypothetical protein pclt_cds_1051 [Pandoravirus celtis]|uniref:Uncharacterized protein n=1 Tax=Pandoravirus celtis TaxID=2568002 RepID=A0A4D6EIP1_9VIRU|nr:hypothetical protein pclt_cds_1051 [Pandoravirus celtis]
MASSLELLLWHCPPVVDALAARLPLAAVAALGATSSALRDVMHGPGVLGRRLMAEGAFCFRSPKVLGPWARNGAFASVDQAGGDIVVRVCVPPEILSDVVRWSRCRGRLTDAWVRVRDGGCPVPPDLFAEGVLAGAACGDARLVSRCIGSVTEYMCRTDDYAQALDAVTALNDRAWHECDLARAAPIVIHVTTLLLARAHALATGDRVGGSISMAEAMYDPKDDDMGRLYQCSACHIGAGLERIEAEALRRLFGAFCNDLSARSPEACILAAHVVGLFTGTRRHDAALCLDSREGAVAALVRDCIAAAPEARDRDPRWYAMLACVAADLTHLAGTWDRLCGAPATPWVDAMDACASSACPVP